MTESPTAAARRASVLVAVSLATGLIGLAVFLRSPILLFSHSLLARTVGLVALLLAAFAIQAARGWRLAAAVAAIGVAVAMLWLPTIYPLVRAIPAYREVQLASQDRSAVSDMISVANHHDWSQSGMGSTGGGGGLLGMPYEEVDFARASSTSVAGTITLASYDPKSAAMNLKLDNEATTTAWGLVDTSLGPGIVSLYRSSSASAPVSIIIWVQRDSSRPVRIAADLERAPSWASKPDTAAAQGFIDWLGVARRWEQPNKRIEQTAKA